MLTKRGYSLPVKLIIVLTTAVNGNSQDTTSGVNLIDCIYPPVEDYVKTSVSPNYDFYYDPDTWIPYCISEPLKNPPITTVEVTFHVFLDDNGDNCRYLNNQQGKDALLDILREANNTYQGRSAGPSDPVTGVTELPGYDTRIRFSLGEAGQERIYFYNNTDLNHDWDDANFSSYIQTNFPARDSFLNVYWTAGHYKGWVSSEEITITNHGTGYTSPPVVTFSHSGRGSAATGTALIEQGHVASINITYEGEYYGFDPPTITISGGGGSGASAVVNELRPNCCYGILPNYSNMRFRGYVVMNSSASLHWTWWMNQGTLAHELGHNFELLHTYCGGGASVVCCTSGCLQSCAQNCNSPNYLSDIFGSCPGTCPHIHTWAYGAWDNGPSVPDANKITNNILAGTAAHEYISPMQAGQMHRALALTSVRQYVKDDTYSAIPYIITSDELWDFSIRFYRDIIIDMGAEVTCTKPFLIPENATVTVKNGAKLILDGEIEFEPGITIITQAAGCVVIKNGAQVTLPDNATITAQSGGNVIINSGATVTVQGSGQIHIAYHGHLCIQGGTNIILQDAQSKIILDTYTYMGNEDFSYPYSGYLLGSSLITFTGNGSVVNNNLNQIIMNTTYTNPPIENELIRHNVLINLDGTPGGPVVVNPNAKLDIESTGEVIITKDFEVKLNGQLKIK